MDNYENYEPEQQEQLPQPAEETAQPLPAEKEVLTEQAEAPALEQIPEKEPVEEPARPHSPYSDSPYEQAVPPVEKPRKKKKTRKGCQWGKRLLAGGLVLVLVAAGCGITAAVVNSHWEKEIGLLEQVMENKLQAMKNELQVGGAAVQPGIQGSVSGEEMTPGQVYAQNIGAVVAVANQSVTTNIYGQVSETASSGSGFIISPDGYVVSNYHVVEGATSLTVITSDGQEHTAELIGFDATNDISLMKIEGENLPYVAIGSSDELVVGDMVAAIGNPLGELTSTLTVGYVSAKDRIVNTDGVAINMLQTDAAINSGNSGGPLFNMKGEVVGITTAKYSGTSNSGVSIEGIGFAIPMDDVAGMLEDIQIYGYVTGAYLGVMVRDVEESVQAYGLPAGAYVEEVTPGYAAERAGLKAQDIIINLGGYEVTSLNTLTRALRKFEAGETTTITVYRAGQQINLTITLDEKPQSTASEQNPEQMPDQNPEQVQPTDPQYYDDWFDHFWNPFFGFGG